MALEIPKPRWVLVNVLIVTGVACGETTSSIYSPLALTTTSLPAGSEGIVYSYTLAATGGDGNYTWMLVSGNLPAGLNLDGTRGVIDGTPTSAGASSFTLEVGSGDGQTGRWDLSITVRGVLTLTTTSLPNALNGMAYSQALMATGGDGNYTWTLVSGGLPAGLSLDRDQGVIGGAPTSTGSSSFTLEVASGDGQTVDQEFSIEVHAALTPPYMFADDVLVVMPSSQARIQILDANGVAVPPEMITYNVDDYGRCCNFGFGAEILDIDGDGVARPVGSFAEDPFDLRLRATVGATAVTGLMLVVVHAFDRPAEVFRTTEWLLVVPPSWIDDIGSHLPDFPAALDVGLQAQRELMGKTAEDAHNNNSPGDPVLPVSAAIAAARGSIAKTCARALWPIRYTRDCFIYGGGDLPSGTPHWYILFHELGHMSTFEHEDLLFNQFGGFAYLEGEASLQWFWSAHRMLSNSSLSVETRGGVQALLNLTMESARTALQNWAAGSAAYNDEDLSSSFSYLVWNGIHAAIIGEYGWDYLLRYVRAWRDDAYVRSRVGIPGHSMADRATFAAAAVSAAVQLDMKARFVTDWRFPVDDALFDDLYAHFSSSMTQPW